MKQDIPAIKDANPLPDVAEQYGVALRKSGENFTALCPFHDDRNPSFHIVLSDSGWFFKCYSGRCGESGDVLDFVGLQIFGSAWNNRNKEHFKDVLEALGANDKGASKGAVKPKPKTENGRKNGYAQVSSLVILTWEMALGLYSDILMKTPEALEYVHGRGFTERTIRKFRFGYCPRDGSGIEALAGIARISRKSLLEACILREIEREDKTLSYEYFWNRITFVDKSMGRQTTYPVGRKLPDKKDDGMERKFVGPAGFRKPVFNLYGISRKKGSPVFVVEAPWDVITLTQMGFDAVGIGGAHPSVYQKNVLNRLATERPLIPVPDNDAGGQVALETWQEALILQEPLCLPSYVDENAIKDPNDLLQLDNDKGTEVFRGLAATRGISPL